MPARALVISLPLILAATILCLAPPCASADDIELPPVTVKTERPPLLESYSSVTVIDVAGEDTAGKTVADFLEMAPGVQIIRSGSVGQRETVTIRGSDSKQVLVLVEGFHTTDPRAGGADLSQIPLDAVESIEIYRGAKGALAGGSAMGGVVVVRLKKGGRKVSGTRRLTLGGYGGQGYESVSGAWSVQGGGAYFSYAHAQAQGEYPYVDRNHNERTRENNASVSDLLTVTYGTRLAPATRLDLVSRMALTWRESPGLDQQPAATAAEEQSNTFLVGAKILASRFPVDGASLGGKLSWNMWRWTFNEPLPYMPPPSDTLSLNHRFDGSMEARVKLPWKLAMTASVSGARELADISRRYGKAVDESRILGDQAAALLVGDESTRARLNLRLRHTMSSVDAYDNAWVPAAEGEVDLVGGLTLGTSVSRSYRYPTFDEMYLEAAGIRGNPELQPEDMWGADLGLKYSEGPLSAQASVFYHDIEKTILFLPVTHYLIEADNNDHDVVARGAEAEMAAEFWKLRLAASFTWVDALTWVDAGDEELDRQLPLRSPYTGNLQLRFAHGRWAARVTGNYRSAFYFDRYNNLEEEGRVLLGAGGSVELGRGFRLILDVRNLTNKQDAVDSLQHPLPGLSWLATMEKLWTGGSDENE